MLLIIYLLVKKLNMFHKTDVTILLEYSSKSCITLLKNISYSQAKKDNLRIGTNVADWSVLSPTADEMRLWGQKPLETGREGQISIDKYSI